MTPEKLAQVCTLVVHENCPDGLASALILKDAYQRVGFCNPIVFVQHGTDKYLNLPATPGMLFVDIVPPPNRVQEFIDAGALVLDHHKKVQNVVEAFGENGVFADEQTEPGVSGALLAFRHIWKPLWGGRVTPHVLFCFERFARLAGIRDTWQRQDPQWREACAQAEILMFYPVSRWLSEEIWDILVTSDEQGETRWDREFMPIGEVLLERKEASTKRLLDQTYRSTSMKGTRIAMFNNLHSSDVAEALDQEVDLVVGFSYTTETVEGHQKRKLILSTRSHTGFDCSSFCAQYGGGGHTAAAGCSLPLVLVGNDPYAEIALAVNKYERHREP